MSSRGLRVTSRIAFCICGLASLLTAVPYVLLQGVDLPFQSEWVIFVVPLVLLGLFGIGVGLAPLTWLAKRCHQNPDDERVFLAPLRLLGTFAVISYLIAVFAYCAPHTWNLNPQIMLALCPLYLVRMTFDPSPMLICFVLAPLNAAAYGSLGLVVAYVGVIFHKGVREGEFLKGIPR